MLRGTCPVCRVVLPLSTRSSFRLPRERSHEHRVPGRTLELGGCPAVDEGPTAGAFSFVFIVSFLPMLILALAFLVPLVFAVAPQASPLPHTLRVVLLVPPVLHNRSALLLPKSRRSQLDQPTTIALGDGARSDSLLCRRHHEHSHILRGLLSQGGHADEGVTLVALAASASSST